MHVSVVAKFGKLCRCPYLQNLCNVQWLANVTSRAVDFLTLEDLFRSRCFMFPLCRCACLHRKNHLRLWHRSTLIFLLIRGYSCILDFQPIPSRTSIASPRYLAMLLLEPVCFFFELVWWNFALFCFAYCWFVCFRYWYWV